jgi:hypothetical protein
VHCGEERGREEVVEMTHFNITHYFMWMTIGAIPMFIFYNTIGSINIVVKGIIGFLILEFVLLVVAPRVEMKPIGELYLESEKK